MEKSPFQFYRKTLQKKDKSPANFGMQYGKVEESPTRLYTEDEAIQYLAKSLVEAYFKQKRYDRTGQPQ